MSHDKTPFAAGKTIVIQMTLDDNIEPIIEIRLPLLDPPAEALAQLPKDHGYSLPLLIAPGSATTSFCLCHECRADGRAQRSMNLLGNILLMAAAQPPRLLEGDGADLHLVPAVKPS